MLRPGALRVFVSSPRASGSAFYAATVIRCANCKIIEQLDSAKLLLNIYVSEGTYTRGRTRN